MKILELSVDIIIHFVQIVFLNVRKNRVCIILETGYVKQGFKLLTLSKELVNVNRNSIKLSPIENRG